MELLKKLREVCKEIKKPVRIIPKKKEQETRFYSDIEKKKKNLSMIGFDGKKRDGKINENKITRYINRFILIITIKEIENDELHSKDK